MSSKTTTKRARERAVTHEARATRLRFALDRVDTLLDELELDKHIEDDRIGVLCKVVSDAIKSDDQRLEPEAIKQVQEAVQRAMKRVGEQKVEEGDGA